MKEDKRLLQNFWMAGISFKNADASTRGKFAINQDKYNQTLLEATNFNINDVFILSTCNRTEIYGFCEDIGELMNLLCSQTVGDVSTFQELAYINNSKEALNHLYQVACGLDSQLLGDYEIIGQMKIAFNFAKDRGFIGAFMERIFSGAVQAAKTIKNNTAISSGTISVSFAAIQAIKLHISNYQDKKILLIGTGKIGRNTCKNIIHYLETRNITLINRSPEKAQALANELGLKFAPLSDLEHLVQTADIIITSATTTTSIINKTHLNSNSPKLLIDLAVPANIDSQVLELENIKLINVDELSKIKDENIQKRNAEVPYALEFIQQHLNDFYAWYEMRKNVPVLLTIKNVLIDIQEKSISRAEAIHYPEIWEVKLKKVMNTTAVKLKNHNSKGCHFIQAINEYIA